MAHRSVRRRRPIILFTSFNQAATLKGERKRGRERATRVHCQVPEESGSTGRHNVSGNATGL